MKQGKKDLNVDKSMLFAKLQPGTHFSGKVPNLLVGTYGYPNVRVGSLVGDQRSASQLVKEKLNIQEIVSERQGIINSNLTTNVKHQEKYKDETQDIAKSKRAVDTEIEIEKPLRLDTQFHERAMPHGPSAQLKSMHLNENPRIPRAVERLTSDTDAKATTAMSELQHKGTDEYYMTKLLSAGTLGQEHARKLVPTKWSITAVDDTYGTQLQEQILHYKDHDYTIFTGNYLGNHFVVCVQPGDFSYELIEVVLPGSIYNQTNEIFVTKDHEFQQGRKKYASNTAGGYYAAKLPLLEYFAKSKRQGKVTEFRFITPEYNVPLGVWVVREGVRQTLSAKKGTGHSKFDFTRHSFASVKDVKKELLQLFELYYNKPEQVLNESVLLKEYQASLKGFI